MMQCTSTKLRIFFNFNKICKIHLKFSFNLFYKFIQISKCFVETEQMRIIFS